MMDCAICFEKIRVDQKLLRCGHQFHGDCVDQWFCTQKRGSCPLCRTPITTPTHRNGPARERSMEQDYTDEEEYEYEEDQYMGGYTDEEDSHEDDETYEAISEDEVEYLETTTTDGGTESVIVISSSTSASDAVDESLDLESISSNESFSSNESEQGSDSDETDGEELVAGVQTS